MPTLEQLQQESVWRDERVPNSLQEARALLLDHYDWPNWRIGTIGDHKHTKGSHRSRNWIRFSRHCTNRTYSVSETWGNRNGGNGNEIAGMDIITNEVHVRQIDARLRTAKAQGKIPFVWQIILESGPWHNHIGFDRGALNFDPRILFDVITGASNGGTKMVTVNATMPELKEGSEGPHVITWQYLCTRHGFPLKSDGEFGPLTRNATVELQKKYGAEYIDGMVGPETWVIGLAGEDQQ